MSLKKSLVSAASLGLAAGATLAAAPALAIDKAAGEEKCYGINSCKGTGKCGIGKSEVEATKTVFGERFAKSAVHDCSGSNTCGASVGQLNFISVPKGKCISEKKGFLIESKGGKKIVVSK